MSCLCCEIEGVTKTVNVVIDGNIAITIVANVFATYITEFVAAIEHDAFGDDVVIIDDVVVVAATVFAAFIAVMAPVIQNSKRNSVVI